MDRWFNRLWAEDGQVMMEYVVLAFLIVAGYVVACVWVWRVQGWSVWFGLLVTPLVVWAVGIVGRKVCFYFSCRHETIDGYKWTYSIIGNHVKIFAVSPLDGAISIPPTLGQSPITSIENGVFSGCSSLTSVTIPSGVTHIGAEAFRGCSGLTSVALPPSVTDIGAEAFYGCSGLTSVILPPSVTNIGAKAFAGCSGLADANGFVIVGNTLFSYCGIGGNVTIPDIVTSIGHDAFSGCSELTSVTIPDSVTIISDGAFFDCSGLTRVTIGKGVRSIGEFAFVGCGKQMYVTFNGDAPDFDMTFDDIDMTFDEGCTLYVHRGSIGWDGLRAKFDLNVQYISDTAVATNVKSQTGTPTGNGSALGSLNKRES